MCILRGRKDRWGWDTQVTDGSGQGLCIESVGEEGQWGAAWRKLIHGQDMLVSVWRLVESPSKKVLTPISGLGRGIWNPWATIARSIQRLSEDREQWRVRKETGEALSPQTNLNLWSWLTVVILNPGIHIRSGSMPPSCQLGISFVVVLFLGKVDTAQNSALKDNQACPSL